MRSRRSVALLCTLALFASFAPLMSAQQQTAPAAVKRPITHQDYDAWRSIGGVRDAKGAFATPPASNHPQYAMHALLQRFGIKRSDVEMLVPAAPHGRDTLVSEAMRPSNASAR